MKIRQLLPAAPGWRVLWADESRVEIQHIPCWALVDEDDGDGCEDSVIYPAFSWGEYLCPTTDLTDQPDVILEPGEGWWAIRRHVRRIRREKRTRRERKPAMERWGAKR